ncbi:twin-arginine translocase TatA/TatE family subunit [Devriesea agamarum]|uniref:twin-arginine translocase TatA/TatE family subunit n=1 Tax=Devriesea agamarum TaxID=472569 RepID=UPI00071D7FB6|nr:twin-arginine translocase TatA/TatE family subunit [Devriesea agamarum]
MSIFGISGWEFVILLLVFLVVIGPQRLPEYTRHLVGFVKKARKFVDESRSTVENEMGIAVEDLKKYDPRQFDPRRIVREAWGDTNPVEDLVNDTKGLMSSSSSSASASAAGAALLAAGTYDIDGGSTVEDSNGRAPFDPEAT